MKTLYIPGEAGPTDPGKRALLNSLVGEDMDTFSSRELAVLNSALDHGECYWAEIRHFGDLGVEAVSDMGDYKTTVKLSAPPGISNSRLLAALDAAIQVLMSVDIE